MIHYSNWTSFYPVTVSTTYRNVQTHFLQLSRFCNTLQPLVPIERTRCRSVTFLLFSGTRHTRAHIVRVVLLFFLFHWFLFTSSDSEFLPTRGRHAESLVVFTRKLFGCLKSFKLSPESDRASICRAFVAEAYTRVARPSGPRSTDPKL